MIIRITMFNFNDSNWILYYDLEKLNVTLKNNGHGCRPGGNGRIQDKNPYKTD